MKEKSTGKSKEKSSNKGSAIILNSGSVANTELTNPNKYGKYHLQYVVGAGNPTYLLLIDICERLAIKNNRKVAGVKMPWKVDEETNMTTLSSSGKMRPAVMDMNKRVIPAESVKDGDFVKINVTPWYYELEEVSSYLDPDGNRVGHTEIIKGITLILNGVLLLSGQGTEEELF